MAFTGKHSETGKYFNSVSTYPAMQPQVQAPPISQIHGLADDSRISSPPDNINRQFSAGRRNGEFMMKHRGDPDLLRFDDHQRTRNGEFMMKHRGDPDLLRSDDRQRTKEQYFSDTVPAQNFIEPRRFDYLNNTEMFPNKDYLETPADSYYRNPVERYIPETSHPQVHPSNGQEFGESSKRSGGQSFDRQQPYPREPDQMYNMGPADTRSKASGDNYEQEYSKFHEVPSKYDRTEEYRPMEHRGYQAMESKGSANDLEQIPPRMDKPEDWQKKLIDHGPVNKPPIARPGRRQDNDIFKLLSFGYLNNNDDNGSDRFKRGQVPRSVSLGEGINRKVNSSSSSEEPAGLQQKPPLDVRRQKSITEDRPDFLKTSSGLSSAAPKYGRRKPVEESRPDFLCLGPDQTNAGSSTFHRTKSDVESRPDFFTIASGGNQYDMKQHPPHQPHDPDDLSFLDSFSSYANKPPSSDGFRKRRTDINSATYRNPMKVTMR